jgi:hypothetical protein
MSERVKVHRESYFPVFKIDCRNRPYHAGTMIALDFSGKGILVTAAHVLEKDDRNACDSENQIFVFDDGELRQIQKFQTAKLPLPKKGEFLDLSVVIPTEFRVNDVVPSTISLNLLRRSQVHQGLYLAACGFPATKNKRNGRELTNRPYGYFGMVSDDKATERAGYDSRFYFSIKFDLKRSHRPGMKKIKAPSPYGISGGPVFFAHDFSGMESPTSELAGIAVAKDKENKHIVCVRAEFVEHIALTLLGS